MFNLPSLLPSWKSWVPGLSPVSMMTPGKCYLMKQERMMLGVLWQRGRILSGKWHRTLAKNGSKLFILGYCNRGESGLESAGRKGCRIFKPGWWGGRVLVTRGSCWSEVKLLSRVWLFATPWTVANRAPPSMGFSRQEYWSGLPFPSPGELPDPGIEPKSPTLQADT